MTAADTVILDYIGPRTCMCCSKKATKVQGAKKYYCAFHSFLFPKADPSNPADDS